MRKKTLAIMAGCLVIGLMAYAGGVGLDQELMEEYYLSGIVGIVIAGLVGVVIASALLPTIADDVSNLENSSNTFDSSETTMMGIWTLLVVIGVLLAIIGFAF